jgi:integrase
MIIVLPYDLCSNECEPCSKQLRAITDSFAAIASQNSLNPTEVWLYILEVKQWPHHWLSRKEQLALVRAVWQGENQRDLTSMQMKLGAGLRISEVAALKVLDIEMSERSVWVRACMFKGMKSGAIPAMP